MSNEFNTTRVPAFISRIFGRSFRLILGSRNIVITLGLGEVGGKQVGLREGRELAGSRFFGVAPRKLDHVGIVFDADRAGAALRSSDDGAAVAGAEIHQRGRRA